MRFAYHRSAVFQLKHPCGLSKSHPNDCRAQEIAQSANSRSAMRDSASVTAAGTGTPEPSGNVVLSGDLQGEQTRRPIGHHRVQALLHRGFISAGGVLLIAAFCTDCIYYTTALWQWANFSAWLITAGLIVTLIAAILLLADFATGRAGRLNTGAFILVVAAALLSLVNAFVHSRDAWTSVVPQGISLSAVSTILLIIAGTRGWSLAKSRAAGDRP